jgi:O-antigen/teichoic acid export membrane protein
MNVKSKIYTTLITISISILILAVLGADTDVIIWATFYALLAFIFYFLIWQNRKIKNILLACLHFISDIFGDID